MLGLLQEDSPCCQPVGGLAPLKETASSNITAASRDSLHPGLINQWGGTASPSPPMATILGLVPVPELPVGSAEAFMRLSQRLLPPPGPAFPLPFYSRSLPGHSEHTRCVPVSISEATSPGSQCDTHYVRSDRCLSPSAVIYWVFLCLI